MGANEQPFSTKYPTDVPDMGYGPLPVAPYVSRAFFEQEREKVFKRAWLEVAREEDVPNPGDYLVVEVEVLGWSLILTRGTDGTLRAFTTSARIAVTRWRSSAAAMPRVLPAVSTAGCSATTAN